MANIAFHGSPWRRSTAHTMRQVCLLIDGASLMAAVAGRESTALYGGALSAVLRVTADALEGPGGAR
jgi:hypothetical protein